MEQLGVLVDWAASRNENNPTHSCQSEEDTVEAIHARLDLSPQQGH